MAQRDASAEATKLKKRKREKADDREKRGASKKRKSQPKTNGDVQGDQILESKHESTRNEAIEETGVETAHTRDLALSGAKPDSLEVLGVRNEAHGALTSPWKLSRPAGGRMLDIDPVFASDEKHLILTYNTSIQVYSTADSLLVRRIPLSITQDDGPDIFATPRIVSSVLSKVSPHMIWVASADGCIWCIDWTTGAGADKPRMSETRKILDFTVNEVILNEKAEDVLLVLEKTSHSHGRLVAYNSDALETRSGKVLQTCENNPNFIRSTKSASIILVATKHEIQTGVLKTEPSTLSTIHDFAYRFFSFRIEDHITCIDMKISDPTESQHETPMVEIAIGCARGAIQVYTHILNREASIDPRQLQPRILHWHRKAVHSVKWSLDGNYLISGGSESVLVLWQNDTGKRDYLPRVAASIENISVSPRGSSYAILLDDNSAMVLSTADLQPITYISGIQSAALKDQRSKDFIVRRVWQEADDLATSQPAVCSPINASQILLATGSGRHHTQSGDGSTSTPYLQVFDLEYSRGVSKQAIARANTTDVTTTNQGYPITEPAVVMIAFSSDNKWLATVDEWQPPKKDVEAFVDESNDLADVVQQRREIHLKFWEVSEDGSSFQLVSRINEPHRTPRPELILGLASDPSSPQFATIGADGSARIWSSKARNGHSVAGSNLKEQPSNKVGGRSTSEGFSKASGAIDFSEDGSTLFVAFAEQGEAAVFIIDAQSGQVRNVVPGMCKGRVRGLKAIDSCLVILSEYVTVYNVVSDETHYGLSLYKQFGTKTSRTVLAANRQSRSYALVLPHGANGESSAASRTDLAVFSIDTSQPQLVHSFHQHVTTLVPKTSSSGYIVIDSAAQIWSVDMAAESANIAQPLADMKLDQDLPAAEEQMVLDLSEQDDATSDEEMRDGDEEDEAEDYDIHPAVVAPQRLAEVFGTGPAFALPPIEDLFNQVAGLFAAKPAATAHT